MNTTFHPRILSTPSGASSLDSDHGNRSLPRHDQPQPPCRPLRKPLAPEQARPRSVQPGATRFDCSRHTAQRGYTLLGLLAALLVLAIVSAVAISRRADLHADAVSDGEILKAGLRAARTRALADNVSWSFTVAGTTGTFARGVTNREVVTFATAGVDAGTTTFDNRGQPSGKLSYAVTNYNSGSVTVTAGTGFVP